MGEETAERLDVGGIFSETTAIYKRTFVKVWLLALILLVPAQLLSVVLGDSFFSLISSLVYLAAVAWLLGSITKLVQNAEAGQDSSVGELLRDVWPRLLSLSLLTFVTFLLIAVGLVLLVVPGVILTLMWLVAVPVMVIEGLRAEQSMTRSSDLTRDHRLRILWIAMIFLVCELVLVGLSFLMKDDPIALAAVSVGLRILVYPYLAIITTVLYFRLVALKDPEPQV